MTHSTPARMTAAERAWALGGAVLATTGTLVFAGMLLAVSRAFRVIDGAIVPVDEPGTADGVFLPALIVLALVMIGSWIVGLALMRGWRNTAAKAW
ncbi:hypothetical protein, partial [Leucobacter sp. M11]|uniref:hypothetical protein n=1 Tax=Leucobacter sp. M11 TaxID=2993565 RepID=UPI002D7EB895